MRTCLEEDSTVLLLNTLTVHETAMMAATCTQWAKAMDDSLRYEKRLWKTENEEAKVADYLGDLIDDPPPYGAVQIPSDDSDDCYEADGHYTLNISDDESDFDSDGHYITAERVRELRHGTRVLHPTAGWVIPAAGTNYM